ncbi:MAG: arginyltransferase [Rhodospirillales bacterium]|nr:arginyltransferase [Rhodospirillales bacterium]
MTAQGNSTARFYYSMPSPCPYIDGRMERRIFVDLTGPQAVLSYDLLSEAGFRRSLGFAYRPACPGCNACVAVRIPVARFELTRQWRRVLSRNDDLAGELRPAQATAEQYALFSRYQVGRHRDGEMARMDYEDYRTMIEVGAIASNVLEIRDRHGNLMGACLIDRMGRGYSAVYSFYEPEAPQRSLGSYLVLWLIDEARRTGLDHVYLGYWIGQSPKMAYKVRFQPLEALTREGWQPIGPDGIAQRPLATGRPRLPFAATD